MAGWHELVLWRIDSGDTDEKHWTKWREGATFRTVAAQARRAPALMRMVNQGLSQ